MAQSPCLSRHRDGLRITLPVDNRHVSLVLGGWDGEVSALETVDGWSGDESENPTRQLGDPFAENRSHRVKISVRKNSIDVSIDDQPLIEWDGDASRLATVDEVPEAAAGKVVLRTISRSVFNISSFKLDALGTRNPEPIVTSTSAEKRLFDVVNKHKGRVTFRDVVDPQIRAAAGPTDLRHDLRVLKIFLADTKGLSGKDFEILADSLHEVVSADCQLTLDIHRTDVTIHDLVHLLGVPVNSLVTWGAPINAHERPDVCKQLDVGSWDLGASSVADVEAIYVNPTLEELSISINVSGSSDSIRKRLELMGKSSLKSLHFGSWGGVEPTLSDECQTTLRELSSLSKLAIYGYSNLDKSWMIELSEAMPHTSIFRESELIASPETIALRRAAAQGEGLELAGVLGFLAPRSNSYDLEFQAKRISRQREGLGITLPIDDQYVQLVLGGWDGEISQLKTTDGYSATGREVLTHLHHDPFADGHPHHVRIRVRPDAIDVLVDDNPLTNWKGNIDRSATAGKPHESVRGKVVLRTHGSAVFAISSVKLDPL